MVEFTATVAWQRKGEAFIGGRDSRAHTWSFDGGAMALPNGNTALPRGNK